MPDLDQIFRDVDNSGKGLSKNDFTDAAKGAVDGIPYTPAAGVNLIDPKLTILGTYYRNSDGAIAANSGAKRLPLIKVDPNTTYTLWGITTTFPGVEFDENGVKTQSIGTSGPTVNSITFTTHVNTQFVGPNIFGSATDFSFAVLAKAGTPGSSMPAYSPKKPENWEHLIDILERSIKGTGKNLLDSSRAVSGFYYDVDGLVKTGNATSRKCLPLIRVKGNTKYGVSGYSTENFGNEYREDGSFIRTFDPAPNSGTRNKLVRVTHPETALLGLNALTSVATFSGGQLEEGGITDYEAFLTIGSGSATINPSCYYDYTLSTKTFRVFVKYGNSTDLYIGFNIENEIDLSEIGYKNYYRINLAKMYKLVGGAMNDQNVPLLTNGESEFVFQQTGKADFTGGFHGDEQKTDVKFYADGQPVVDTTNIALTACNEFWYFEKSTMHETATAAAPNTPISGHPTIATHYKRTYFRESGYETFNEVTFQAAITVGILYFGISCITTSIGGYVYTDEKGNVVPMVKDENVKLNETGSHSINYYSTANKVGAKAVASVSKFLQNGTDNTKIVNDGSIQQVWDSANYAKYYWRIENKNTTVGDVWAGSCKVKFISSAS